MYTSRVKRIEVGIATTSGNKKYGSDQGAYNWVIIFYVEYGAGQTSNRIVVTISQTKISLDEATHGVVTAIEETFLNRYPKGSSGRRRNEPKADAESKQALADRLIVGKSFAKLNITAGIFERCRHGASQREDPTVMMI